MLVGLSDQEHESIFRWVNYALLGYEEAWNFTQPDGNKDEDCIAIDNDMKWQDISCCEIHGWLCSSTGKKIISVINLKLNNLKSLVFVTP